MSDEMTDLLTEKVDGVAWLRLNRPDKHNAVTYEMWQAIAFAIENFATDESVRVIVVTGEGGRAFSSGADISQFEKQRASSNATEIYNKAVKETLTALTNTTKPTIAQIQGYCLGGGVGIALGCDIRIASEDACFSIPAARLGLAYGFEALRHLTEIVGPAHAKEILFTARRYTVSEAYDMGLVNRVVSSNDLHPFVEDYARTIATNAPLTIRAAKQMITEATKDPDERDRNLCDQLFAACFDSEDYKEGRAAFSEKRDPQFQGK